MAKSPHHVKIVIFKDDGTVEWKEKVSIVIDYDPVGVRYEDDSLEGVNIQAVISSVDGEPPLPCPEGWQRERWGMEVTDTEPSRWKDA